jgi:hypothetical protein
MDAQTKREFLIMTAGMATMAAVYTIALTVIETWLR